MAEKTRYQTWLDSLTPKEEAERKALMELGDQEYMAELQNNLPSELRFGGEFGATSALGYGTGQEDRAQIRGYTRPDGELHKILGAFQQSGQRLGRDITSAEALSTNSIANSGIVKYISDAPDYEDNRSKGISVFTPTSSEGKQGAYGSKDGYISKKGTRYTYPETVQHELQHKGFDHPAFLAFLTEKKGRPLTGREEHRFIDASPNSAGKVRDQEIYRNMMSRFEEWLTPEKQEEYGIRMPLKSSVPAEPSVLDRLMDFIQDK
tara:strand:+ start:136 stop:927 length:792 start_codon:yes stop_codon:yes gene_type:complete